MLSRLDEIRNRVRQIVVERAHVVALANAENVIREVRRGRARVGRHELIEHLEQKDIQSLQLMPHESLVSEARANLIERRGVLGRRISVVLHVGERGLNQLHIDFVLRRSRSSSTYDNPGRTSRSGPV